MKQSNIEPLSYKNHTSSDPTSISTGKHTNSLNRVTTPPSTSRPPVIDSATAFPVQNSTSICPSHSTAKGPLYPASVPVVKGRKIDYSNLQKPVYLPNPDPLEYTYFLYPGMAGTGDGLCPDGTDRSDNCWSKKTVCSVDPSHFTMIRTGKSCGSPACRHHWKGWAYRAAQRTRAHVCGFQQATNYPYPARHIILSLDKAERLDFLKKYRYDEVIPWKKLRSHFLKTAKSCGITGGAIIMHAYRVRPESGRNSEVAGKSGT